ncbi:MAG: NADH-quinone oxidoreductase subunit NuoG [Desulfosarcinaceae bacterium]
MPKLVIDNRQIEVPADTKVIEAAQQLGIVIPRFCYHPALGSVGACRVCAVAFKEGPVKGIQMSCMVDALDGMVVSTTDPEAVDFRRHVIEWLMLNHPHDCPVCDEGGHCLLQDTTVSGGHGLRRYLGRKRTHVDQELGPLVQHEMNRCIQCYRCARFYQEYCGYRDLGVLGIGSRVWFGRSAPGRLDSPFAGNLIDICPTGVYTDKPSRYFGRRWDFQRAPSLCLHCSLGCNLVASARYRQVVRHEARPNEAVNGHFICDRGRYGYAYASLEARPRQALVQGKPTDMEVALDQAVQQLQHTAEAFGPGSVAVVASPRSSLETLAMLAQTCRQNQWQAPVAAMTAREAENLHTAVTRLKPSLAVSLGAVASARTVVVIGADPLNEAPMLALSLRQAQRRGGHVTVIDPRGIRLPLPFDHLAVHPAHMGSVLEYLIRAIEPGRAGQPVPALPDAIDPGSLKALADRLAHSRGAVVVCGTDMVTAQEVSLAAELAETLRQADVDATLFYTLAGANAFAAGLGCAPAAGVETLITKIEAGTVHALVAAESDVWWRYPDRSRLQAALERLDLLVELDYLASPLGEKAQIFIPTQTIYEAGGHWINQEGRMQAAQAVLKGGEPVAVTGGRDHPPRIFDSRIPGDEAMAAWQIAVEFTLGGSGEPKDRNSLLAEALRAFHPTLETADLGSAGQRIPLETAAEARQGEVRAQTDAVADSLALLLVDRTFGTEPLSARTAALAGVEDPPAAEMHPRTIEELGLTGDEEVSFSSGSAGFRVLLKSNDNMAPGVAVIPRHHTLGWQIFSETRLVLKRNQFETGAANTIEVKELKKG